MLQLDSLGRVDLAARPFLADKYEKFQEYMQQNANVSKENVAEYLVKTRSTVWW